MEEKIDRVIKELIFTISSDKKRLGIGEAVNEGEEPGIRSLTTVPIDEEGIGLALKTAIARHYRDLRNNNPRINRIEYAAREAGTDRVLRGYYP